MFRTGDLVYARNFSGNGPKWISWKVVAMTGPVSMVIILSDGQQVRRHIDHGKAPVVLSTFLARGNLTALNKLKSGGPFDIRPIAVGETLCRLTEKSLCVMVKVKATNFFHPFHDSVACPFGAEKIAHGLRACIDEHWGDDDLAVLKIDMRNDFNVVSQQSLLSECAKHFSELLPWVYSWCYSQQPFLWHPQWRLRSKSGVQQGDSLGPLFFPLSLVLNVLITAITKDSGYPLLFHAWYLDDGALAGPRSSLCSVLKLIQELGPSLGLHINISKYEVFSCKGLSSFPPEMKHWIFWEFLLVLLTSAQPSS